MSSLLECFRIQSSWIWLQTLTRLSQFWGTQVRTTKPDLFASRTLWGLPRCHTGGSEFRSYLLSSNCRCWNILAWPGFTTHYSYPQRRFWDRWACKIWGEHYPVYDLQISVKLKNNGMHVEYFMEGLLWKTASCTNVILRYYYQRKLEKVHT